MSIPRAYREPPAPNDKGVYIVYGNFCSLSCCKAYLLDANQFSSNYELTLLSCMANDVYGVRCDVIKRAPPRLMLQMFGGPLSIEEFRSTQNTVSLRINGDAQTVQQSCKLSMGNVIIVTQSDGDDRGGEMIEEAEAEGTEEADDAAVAMDDDEEMVARATGGMASDTEWSVHHLKREGGGRRRGTKSALAAFVE